MPLAQLIDDYKSRFGLNEYELWRLVKDGFPGFFRYRNLGMMMDRDMVVMLQRASASENGWFLDGEFIPMAEWKRRYQTWQPS